MRLFFCLILICDANVHTCSYKYSNMTLSGCSIDFHQAGLLENEENLAEITSETKCWTIRTGACITDTVIFAACGQWASPSVRFLHDEWCQRQLLFSGALMWCCTGQSAAPCPAVSTAASCGVWAEADEPEVQEAPAPRWSLTSSPALSKKKKKPQIVFWKQAHCK